MEKTSALRFAAGMCVLVVTAILAGCSSGFSLVSIDNPKQWEHVVGPRPPTGEAEEAACTAGSGFAVVTSGDITAIPLSQDGNSQIVAVVVDRKHDFDEMAPKDVTYYTVNRGRVVAHTEPVLQPSPDVDYERTVFSAALQAFSLSGFSAIPYNRADSSLTLRGKPLKTCISNVRVMHGFEKSGEILAERDVMVCPQPLAEKN